LWDFLFNRVFARALIHFDFVFVTSDLTLSFASSFSFRLFSHPGYFGKLGMRYLHKTKQQFYSPIVNIDRLWSLIPEEARKRAETDPTQAPVIDVTKSGYYRVLGRGSLPKIPVIVKARFFSLKAEKKIKEAGGVCKLTA
jgi:large subunit ribosomal protein L27Ae